jgi:surface antigen
MEKTMLNAARLLLLGCGLILSAAAGAQYGTTIGGAPIAWMTEEDIAMYQDAIDKAMETSADGAMTKWKNPATNSGGTIKPLRSFKQGETPCREAQLDTRAKGRHAKGVYAFCKDPDGKWKLTPGASGKQ